VSGKKNLHFSRNLALRSLDIFTIVSALGSEELILKADYTRF